MLILIDFIMNCYKLNMYLCFSSSKVLDNHVSNVQQSHIFYTLLLFQKTNQLSLLSDDINIHGHPLHTGFLRG